MAQTKQKTRVAQLQDLGFKKVNDRLEKGARSYEISLVNTTTDQEFEDFIESLKE